MLDGKSLFFLFSGAALLWCALYPYFLKISTVKMLIANGCDPFEVKEKMKMGRDKWEVVAACLLIAIIILIGGYYG